MFQDIISPGNYTGDIESLSVYKATNGDTSRYAISAHVGDPTSLIAFFEVRDHSEVITCWVEPSHRRRGLFAIFLWFLKVREGVSRIIIGDSHSRDTIESIKRISARFKTSWYNRETEEIVPYAPETIDQYYSTAHATPWVVILENTLNLHHPRIFEATRVATWYHPLLDYSGFAGPVDTE